MMKHLRKRVKTVLAFALCFCFAYAARSQSGTISGTVTSKGDGSPLPGVNVIVKGTSIGTSTDADGKYTINAGENAVVIFSFIGYTSQEVPTGNQTTVDVVLIEDATQLGEIVVTALGIAKEAAKVGYSIS
jgi:hypothetical protein